MNDRRIGYSAIKGRRNLPFEPRDGGDKKELRTKEKRRIQCEDKGRFATFQGKLLCRILPMELFA